MSLQANQALRRLVERDKRKDLKPTASITPIADDAKDPDAPIVDELAEDDDNNNTYEGLDWRCVPELERRQKEYARGQPSWIYCYGWAVYHCERQRNYWLCCYCHLYRRLGGLFDVSTSTSSAGAHLKQLTQGHRMNANGLIKGNGDPNQGTLVA